MRGYFGEYTPGLITAATITPLAGVIICPHLCSTRRLFVGDVAVTALAACMCVPSFVCIVGLTRPILRMLE
jgi:hypothetical protein